MNKQILIELIEEMAVFESENPQMKNYGLKDFLSFMQTRSYDSPGSDGFHRHDGGDKRPDGFDFHQNTSVVLARLISLMYRYAKEYTKRALENSKLQTVEEFSFLIVLMTYDELSKTELIQKNVMSKTSGTEVIKRLLKKELINQFRDKNDKRIQLVSITDAGLAEMKKVFPKMQLATEIISGNLSENEKHNLAFLLQKLELHHHKIYLDKKDEPLEDLI